MGRSLAVGCLALLAGLSLVAFVLGPVFVDAVEHVPLLGGAIVGLFEMTWPLGPPLVVMALFAVIGSSRRFAKRAARMAAALALHVPLFLIAIGYAFTESFVLPPEEIAISALFIAIAVSLGAWGFSHDADPSLPVEQP